MPVTVGAVGGVIQAGYGIYKDIRDKKVQKSLLSQEIPFQTSQQVFDILNATLNNAQGDTATRNYETGQVNQALSNSLGVATKLGANPNDLSGLFQQSLNGIMQVGEQYHQSNTQAFSNILNAYKLVSDNKDAEYASKQNMIKDKLAAAGVNLQSDTQNISGGFNAVLAATSAKQTANLFKQKNQNTTDLSSMLNNYLFSNGVNNQTSGPVTNQDMFNSMAPNNNNTTG